MRIDLVEGGKKTSLFLFRVIERKKVIYVVEFVVGGYEVCIAPLLV